MLRSLALWSIGVGFALWCVGDVPSAQAPPTDKFEVASIKPNNSGDDQSTNVVMPGGRYMARNVTLRTLMRSAYGVQESQIVGGPTWVSSDRFDVTAKAASAPAATSAFREQLRPLLQDLLADRFKLMLHHELREIRIYALVVARRDGKLGPRLSLDVSCTATSAAQAAGQQPIQTPGDPSGPMQCGAEYVRAGQIVGKANIVSLFVTRLSGWVDRVIVDKTGLTGKYDWDLEWTPDPGLDVQSSGSSVTSPDSSPPLFTALQEQLGLKLESTTGPVDVLVIDSVERPTPD